MPRQNSNCASTFMQLPDDELCLICNLQSHGTHFGIQSCRACASFFRRTIVENKSYICRRGENECVIGETERHWCRLCRFNKCKAKGMSSDHVQFNRDRISFIAREDEPSTSEPSSHPNTFGDPKQVPKNVPRDKMDYKTMEILENFDPYKASPEIRKSSSLMAMVTGFHKYRHPVQRHVRIVKELDMKKATVLWEQQHYRFAEFLMYSPEFRSLSKQHKYKLFHLSRFGFERFELLQLTLKNFGKRALEDKILMHNKEKAYIKSKVTYDSSFVSDNFDSKHIQDFFAPNNDRLFKEIGPILFDLDLTDVEFVYILCNYIFSVEFHDVPIEIIETSTKFQHQLADDIHKYYVETLKTTNYAYRLNSMMDLLHRFEDVQNDLRKLFELGHLFTAFKFDLSTEVTRCVDVNIDNSS